MYWKNEWSPLRWSSLILVCDHVFIVYIRGLPSSLNTDEITETLLELDYVPRRVTNVPRKENGVQRPLSLFRIELEPKPNNSEIYNLINLLQVRIRVESFKSRTAPTQCRNCQRFEHTRRYSLRAPRCIKYDADHDASVECQLRRADLCTCANCGGSHPAHRGCEQFRKIRQKLYTVVDEICRCEATPHSTLQTRTPSTSYAAITQLST